jgi:hypothetical protein
MVIFHSYVKLPEGTGSQNIETSARRCPLWDIQREHFATGTGKKRWFTVTNQRRFKKHGMKFDI